MATMESKTEIRAGQTKADFADLLIALISGLSFALVAMFICATPLSKDISGERDFVIYWATGQQLVHHVSPFDAAVMGRIEHEAGLPKEYTVGFMRNPPWGLPLALPLGFLGVRMAAFVWSLVLLMCLTVSVHTLWLMQGRQRNCIHWLGYSFAPAVLALLMGQTSLFLLLGYVLFLRLHGTRPFLAGMSLWLCTLKPHLFLPFVAVLLAWIVVSRSYKVLAGAAVALAASFALTYWIDPMAWTQYARSMQTTGIEKEFLPCLSIALRLWVSPKTMWLQYLPSGLGCAWALGYYWTRRQAWDWMKDGSLPMIVSIFVSPFCWVFDQALVIPALLQGAYLTRSRVPLAVLAVAGVVIEIEMFRGINMHSPLYLWTAPGWFAWYLIATGIRKPHTEAAFAGAASAD